MAFELFDRGTTKAVARVNTTTGAVEGQGIASAAPVRLGEMDVTLEEPIGAAEFFAWGQRLDAQPGEVRINRQSDTVVRVTTLTPGGTVAPGIALVVLARVAPFAAVASAAPTPSVLEYYVNNVTGDDANPGTPALPLATLDEALRQATLGGSVDFSTVIRLQPTGNPYVQTVEPVAQLNGVLAVAPDETTFATAYTVLDTQAAQAGTGAQLVVGVAVGAVQGKSIRLTSGAGAGQRRIIRDVTGGTDIVPACAFSPAPAPGDTFEIFEPAVVVDQSSLVNNVALALLSGPAAVASRGGQPFPAFMFAGLTLNGADANVSGYTLALYGTDGTSVLKPQAGGALCCGVDSFDPFVFTASAGLPSVLGAAGTAWRGWGFNGASRSLFIQGGDALLVAVTLDLRANGGRIRLCGGRVETATAARAPISLSLTPMQGGGTFSAGASAIGDVPAVIERLAAAGAFDEALQCSQGWRVLLGELTPLIINSTAAGVQLSGPGTTGFWGGANVTGTVVTDAVRCVFGAQLELQGAPVYGDAVATDWDCGNGAPVNKAAFAASPSAISFFVGANANGSVIQRPG